MQWSFTCVVLMVCLTVHSQAQTTSDSLARYYDMSLDDLQKLKASGVSSELEKFINSLITVASQKSMSTRETPGIVTLITGAEISKSGARDLTDVLRLVPGFDFGYDGESGIGLGVRGNWANDGKVLFLIDGQLMNEIFKGSLSFGNHFPISNIDRIEIIRGPGSAIYGGFAELGVINIITKKGSEINGANAAVTLGQTSQGYARRNLEVAVGKQFGALDISLHGLVGQGNRSDRISFLNGSSSSLSVSNLYSGAYYSLSGQSDDNPLLLNLKTEYKGLRFKTIFDSYNTSVLQIGDEHGNRFLNQVQKTINTELSYELKIGQKLSVTPKISYISQVPKIKGLPDTLDFSQNYGKRTKAGIIATYNPTRRLNIILGSEFYKDKASNSTDSIRTVSGSVSSISYKNYAAFTQITLSNRIANLILGGRYDHNSNYGDAFVPRVGITKKYHKLHGKLLYSQSFRAPTFENISNGVTDFESFTPGIKPEKTTVMEFEGGYQIDKYQFLSINVFDTKIKDPIVHNSTLRLYSNYNESGTKGFEIEYKVKYQWLTLNTNYSFYSVQGKKKIEAFTTKKFLSTDVLLPTGEEANKNILLAFPAHKVSINAVIKFTKRISFSPTAVYMSERYGYEPQETSQPGQYTLTLHRYKGSILANAYLSFDTSIPGFSMGAGIYNMLNTQYSYLTPSLSRNGSLPISSREFLLRLSYRLNSK
jgi:outer membrane cobalamin receptor